VEQAGRPAQSHHIVSGLRMNDRRSQVAIWPNCPLVQLDQSLAHQMSQHFIPCLSLASA
jgi:hypothetical protein